MKVLLWECKCDWLCQLVLWDGENTYWTDEMELSSGYKNLKQMNRRANKIDAKWTLIGEL